MADQRVLTLLAASGLAREVLAVPGLVESYDDVRMLDDDATLWGTTVGGVPVVGGIDEVRPDDHVLVCAGRGTGRRAITGRLQAGQRFATVVHPSVDVPATCEVGEGSILLAHVALTTDVALGRHVVVMPNATLTHDDRVGDFATICAGVSLAGSVVVEEGAYLGMNASVRENLHLGRDAVVAMGAVVVDDVPAGQLWVGVPARRRDEMREVS